MTPRERKYHYNKKCAVFWKKFFKGEQSIQARPFMFFECTPEGTRIVEDGNPGEPVTVTLSKPNYHNNLRYKIIPREEILEHIFDLTYGQVSEN